MYTGETINVIDACLGGISALSTTSVLVVVLMIVVAIFFDRRSNPYKIKRVDITITNQIERHWIMDWPAYDDIQFPRGALTFVKEPGQGQFGQMYLAVAKSIVAGEAKTTVAVKMTKKLTCELAYALRKEIDIIREFDSPYIIKLLGVCTTEEPVYLIVEHMSYGNLKKFVTDARPVRVAAEPAKLSVQQLVRICRHVAAGVSYMASRRFVHRDIAARNCSVDEGLVVKVSDFGMSRNVYQMDYYKFHGRTIPVRWMAPEAIKDHRSHCTVRSK